MHADRTLNISHHPHKKNRSQWPRGQTHGSVSGRLLGLRV